MHSHDAEGDADATEWVPIDGIGYVWRRTEGPALFVSPFPVTDATKRMTPRWWTFDARPWLSEIRTPTLVICGDSDSIAPNVHSRALHEAIPGSRLVELPNAGHSPVLTRRADLRLTAPHELRLLDRC